MSYKDYRDSQEIFNNEGNYSFYALIMAAMREADGMNLKRLKQVYPAIYTELKHRYNAPGGKINNEEGLT